MRISINYKYFLKSTRKNITKSRYWQKRLVSFRGVRSPIMFVRAPKHFKAGKQHLFLFNGVFRRHTNVQIHPSCECFFFENPGLIINSIKDLREFHFTDTVVSRVTLSTSAVVSLVIMVGVIFFQLIVNAVLFSCIFWIITFVAKWLYSSKYYDYKLNFYECGFKNLTLKKPVYELNFILVVLFLLIYDGEFLVLIPYSLNPSIITIQLCMFFLFFMFWFIITLLLDYAYAALEWQV